MQGPITNPRPVRQLLRQLWLSVGCSIILGCTGLIEDPTNNGRTGGPDGPTGSTGPSGPAQPGEPASFAFSCDPNVVQPPPSTTRRLTRDQLVVSVRTLLSTRLGDRFDAVWPAVQEALAQVPPDEVSSDADFARMSQAVGQSHVDAWYGVARRVGQAVTATPQLIQSFFGACADDPDAACVQAFVESFGRQALRRPLTSQELQFFVDTVYNDASGADAWAATLTAMLSSPGFLYLFELGDLNEPAAEVRRLGPYELATRLAMHFWRSVPDQALLDAAASGRLSDPTTYREEVRRVFQDPRTQDTIDAFVYDWLDLDRVPDPSANVGRDDFRALVGDDVPTATLRDEAIQEVYDLVRHYVWTEPGGLDDLFSSTLGFPRTGQLAALYGLDAPWAPGRAPVDLGPDRTGPLTRVALLLNDHATTRPIIKGVRVRKRVLCDDLELPQDMDDIKLDTADGERSLRARIEALTEIPGSQCAGCHNIINPTGWALEGFDPLGRARAEERVFDGNGDLLGTHAVDTSGDVVVDARSVSVAGPADLGRYLSESDQARACFARKYVRFTFGREEVLPDDACLMESIRSTLEDGATLAEVLESVALHPSFSLVRK